MNTADMEEELAHRRNDRHGNRPLGPADPDRVKAILDAAPDARDLPPIPRSKVEAIARSYAHLKHLQDEHRATTAEMLRACIARVKSNDSRKRRDGIKALETLAGMLEGTL